MKTLIFTPTNRYGGLDVLWASLKRQDYREFGLFVIDQLFEERKDIWRENFKENDFKYGVFVKNVPIKEGNKRNLALSYNIACDYAIENDYELLISLQDYIWVNEKGISLFVETAERLPDDIYTGVTHISRDPFPNQVYDKRGLFTIFKEPFYDQPKRMAWEDVRVKEIYRGAPPGSLVADAEPGHWEANWSALPVSLLKKGLRWDEKYDVGIAYENMDFAQRAKKDYGAKTVFDTGNIAISLPHKDYFEGEKKEIKDFSNRELYESQWN